MIYRLMFNCTPKPQVMAFLVYAGILLTAILVAISIALEVRDDNRK